MSLNPVRYLLVLPPFEKALFLFSAVFHVVALCYSTGYHHADEHFQILEFAAYKLGLCTHESLAWEYDAGMRSGLQPAIAYGIHKCLLFIGRQHQPFLVSDILRFFSISLGFISLIWLRRLADFFSLDQFRKLAITACLCLFPLIPYIHARFSSENYSGIMAILAMLLLFQKGRPHISSASSVFFLSGLCWGFGFGFRYQLGLAALACGLWLLFIERVGWKRFWIFAAGIIASQIALLPVDFWLYGKISYPPANYLYQTLMKPGHMFGASPWYYYTALTWNNAIFPLNLIIVGGLVFAWLRRPFDVINLIILLFIAAHSGIGHKEFRFLFPVFPFILFSIARNIPLGNMLSASDFWAKAIRHTAIVALIPAFAMLNWSANAIPASPDVNTFRFLRNEAEKQHKILVYSPYDIGYVMAHYYEFRYFRNSNIQVRFYPNEESLIAQKPAKGSYILVWNEPATRLMLSKNDLVFRSDEALRRWDFLRSPSANTDRYSIYRLRNPLQ